MDSFSDDEVMPEAQIFTSRAKNYRETCAEEIKKMLSKMNNEPPKNSTPAKKGRKKRGKKLQKVPVLEESDDFGESPKTPKLKLQPAIKKRLQKLEEKRKRDIKRMEAANEYVLSSCNSLPATDIQADISTDAEVFRNKVTLKIRYMSDVIRIAWDRNEKFAVLFNEVANSFSLKASEILLFVNDKTVNVDDTPSSLKLTIFDTIECIPFKATENIEMNQDLNRIQIKVQSNDSRKKVDMYVHKLEQMKDIMERYAAMRDIALDCMIFEFDGDKINGMETPEELEMETGCCVDVNILSGPKKIIPAEKDQEDEEIECLTHNIIPSSMMTVVEILDESSKDSDILIVS